MTLSKLGTNKRDRWYISISAIIFVIAMTQPAFYQIRRDDMVIGSAMCLAIGAMGLLAGYFEWLANPLILFSWIAALRGRRYQSAVSATLALILMGAFLFHSTMSYPLYEREPNVPIVGHGLGYWLWMVSGATMVIGFYGALLQARKSEAV